MKYLLFFLLLTSPLFAQQAATIRFTSENEHTYQEIVLQADSLMTHSGIQYRQICRTNLIGMPRELEIGARRNTELGAGYIVPLGNTNRNTFMVDSIAHLKWKDVDSKNQGYFLLVSNFYGETIGAIPIKGHEVFIYFPKSALAWKCYIVSEKGRKSTTWIIRHP